METQPQNQELAELKELDRRRAGALAITLWWVKGTQHTYVEVIDMDAVPPTVTEIPPDHNHHRLQSRFKQHVAPIRKLPGNCAP
jgi:hypothetical protein